MNEPRTPEAELVDLEAVKAACLEKWNFVGLTSVNGVAVSLSVIEGSYFAHYHPDDDELFLVLEGRLLVHLPDEVVELAPGQGLKVSAGVTHRAEAPGPVVALNVKGNQGEMIRVDE